MTTQTFRQYLEEEKSDLVKSAEHKAWHGKMPGIPRVFSDPKFLNYGPKKSVIQSTGVSDKHLWDIHDHLTKEGFTQPEGSGYSSGDGEESVSYDHHDGKRKVLIIRDLKHKTMEVSSFHSHR